MSTRTRDADLIGTSFFVAVVRYGIPEPDDGRADFWTGAVGEPGTGYRDDNDQETFARALDAALWLRRRLEAKLSNGIISQGGTIHEYRYDKDEFDDPDRGHIIDASIAAVRSQEWYLGPTSGQVEHNDWETTHE